MSAPVESPIWASLCRIEELARRLHQLDLNGDPDLSGGRHTAADRTALIQELLVTGEQLGGQTDSLMAGPAPPGRGRRGPDLGPPAGTIAHDLNNLLSIMQGHLELLGDSADPPHSVGERADRIAAAALRGKALVANFSAISRPETADVPELRPDDATGARSGEGGLVASDPFGRHESGA